MGFGKLHMGRIDRKKKAIGSQAEKAARNFVGSSRIGCVNPRREVRRYRKKTGGVTANLIAN